jgi:hypothetical protein
MNLLLQKCQFGLWKYRQKYRHANDAANQKMHGSCGYHTLVFIVYFKNILLGKVNISYGYLSHLEVFKSYDIAEIKSRRLKELVHLPL